MNLSEVKLPSNRSFGAFFSFAFLGGAGYFLWNDAVLTSLVAALFGGVFGVTAIIKEKLLLPLNKLWMKFGLTLGLIVSPIVLGSIFFILITPVALVMRLFGRDELKLKNRQIQSFWKPRDLDGLNARSFKNQF
ncbi:MAG: SxtJ family membrane protein [Cycloclasticus sp.]|jgi:hypothetical protein